MKTSNASLPTGKSRHRAECGALGSHHQHAASKQKGNKNPGCSDKLSVLARTSQQESTGNPAHCLQKQFVLPDAGVRVHLCGFASHTVFSHLWLDHIEDQENIQDSKAI